MRGRERKGQKRQIWLKRENWGCEVKSVERGQPREIEKENDMVTMREG